MSGSHFKKQQRAATVFEDDGGLLAELAAWQAPAAGEDFDTWLRECEFDFEIADLLLCSSGDERPEAPEFDFAMAFEQIDLDAPLELIVPEPAKPSRAAHLRSRCFAFLRPTMQWVAAHRSLHWLLYDLNTPVTLPRFARLRHSTLMMTVS